MGISTDTGINLTKLRDRLLAQFPGMTAQFHGKVLLVCDSKTNLRQCYDVLKVYDKFTIEHDLPKKS